MSSVLPLGPNQKDNPTTPHRQTLQSQFTVGLTVIFHCDQWEVKSAFKVCQINLVLLEIAFAPGLNPRDH